VKQHNNNKYFLRSKSAYYTEGFLKDHVTLRIGVMMLKKVSFDITGKITF